MSAVGADGGGYMQNRLCFSVYGELYVVNLDMVMFFQADDHYTHVYYASGTHFMIPFGLSKVETSVAGKFTDGTHFVRLGRKYIINTRRIFHVNAVRQVVLLTDDHGTNHTLHLPKPVLRQLMDMLCSEQQK